MIKKDTLINTLKENFEIARNEEILLNERVDELNSCLQQVMDTNSTIKIENNNLINQISDLKLKLDVSEANCTNLSKSVK